MDRNVPKGTLVFGEVGLAGEVRRVSRAAARMKRPRGWDFIVLSRRAQTRSLAFAGRRDVSGISRINELADLLFD